MKSLIILVVIFQFQLSFGQIVTIPDANFKNALINTLCVDTDGVGGFDDDVDTNNDGEIQVSEAEAVISLNVSNQNISNLEGIFSFINLEHLSFDDNQLSGNIDFTSLINLKVLSGSVNQLTSVDISNLLYLEQINFSGNQLTAINFSGASNIEYFEATDNLLTELDFTNLNQLISINCYNNNISSINLSGLINLNYLICNNNAILDLDVSDLTSLIDLDCSNNQITNLELGDITNITSLVVSGNYIGSLDLNLLTELDVIRCSRNNLTNLDVSNQTNLVVLECNRNVLTSLYLGNINTLIQLDCSFNELTDLNLNNLSNLTTLNCQYNNLVNLSVGEQFQIESLDCSYNQLEYLIIKNGIAENSINFSNNDDINYICSDEDEFDVIQQLITDYNYQNVVLNSYCSFVPGGEYANLYGETRIDLDANGCGTSDNLYPNIKVSVSNIDGEAIFFSNDTGTYSIPLQPADYVVTPILENFDFFTITPTQINLTIDENDYNRNFCIVANGIHNDLEVSMFPISLARPGFNATYKIVYKNKGNLPISGNVSLDFNDDFMDFVSSNPIIDIQTPNTISWNYDALLPFESREIFLEMILNTPTDVNFPLVDGDLLTYNVSINPIVNDEIVDDNLFTLKQTVVNSFDPNDKTCLEGDIVNEDMIGKYVHYLIRFENTGSASAVNIVVTDEIDVSKFDISTLVPISSSHSMKTIIKNNKVEFNFENIYLPFDDATNDGYILFKIKTLPTLQFGDTFENIANIYFDFNPAIVTNVVSTTISNILDVNDNHLLDLEIFPNPVANQLVIKCIEEINAVCFYDLNGKIIKKITPVNPKNKMTININEMRAGTYMVKITAKNKQVIKKVILQ